jgi:hypothetical protein
MTPPIRPQRDPREEIRRYIASLPGVGSGFLDTLDAIAALRGLPPFQYDTSRTVADVGGESRRPNRVIFNPATYRDPAHTISHEVLGHLLDNLGSSARDEQRADARADALMRITGRREQPGAQQSPALDRRLLDLLAGIRPK